MGRILFWVLLGLLVYLGWRWWNVKQQLLRGGKADAAERRKAGAEAMVACDICGLNVPKSEALSGNGRWYCSDEHRRLGPG